SVFRANTNTAIYNVATLNVVDSMFGGPNPADGNMSGTSGAIDVSGVGTANIINSTFQNNQASQSGGAVGVVGGTVNILNSTFASNQSTSGSGGGIIVSSSGTLNVTNSTFSGNSSTQGRDITVSSGTAVVKNSIMASINACSGTFAAGSV